MFVTIYIASDDKTIQSTPVIFCCIVTERNVCLLFLSNEVTHQITKYEQYKMKLHIFEEVWI
jgi:hypothetical protein